MDTQENLPSTFTAFCENRRIAGGTLAEVALKVQKKLTKDKSAMVLIFDDQNGKSIDLDLRGSKEEILARLPQPLSAEEGEKRIGPGRPKLGVVSREISLLPRHWEWLSAQTGGASVTLRKLVEDAKKKNAGRDRIRGAQEAAYRFMSAMTGNLPSFEEALRALYARDERQFSKLVSAWPADLRDHAHKLAQAAFD